VAEEALAKKRLISIASSSLVTSNPGRKKKLEDRRHAFKRLCESYDTMSLTNLN
jgi:hypothetical protein